jgi:hypothetical protein
MHLPRYKYKINKSFSDYEFTSEGPKGVVKKIVRFSGIDTNVYNLAFGDLDKHTGDINDTIVTNNNDSHKVLATVAMIVYDFTAQYPKAVVVAKGSTHSRTRLYRMGITNHWQAISIDFEVFGLLKDEWAPFETRRDYEAFLIYRK